MDRCANCGAEVPAHEPGTEREVCAECGGVTHVVELSGTVSTQGSLSAGLSVERGVNEARMAGFALIFATGVGVGLTVGFAASSALLGTLSGLLAAALTALSSP